ncbi:hypothetical protein [Persephonella sp.]
MKVLSVLILIAFLLSGCNKEENGIRNTADQHKILIYAVNRFPVFNFEIEIYKIKNNKKTKVSSWKSNSDLPYVTIYWKDNETFYVKIKGGFQDKDGRLATYTDRIPNKEILSGYVNPYDKNVVISTVTTALSRYSGIDVEKYFSLISKLPSLIKKAYTKVKDFERSTDLVYYISYFVDVDNIKEELSDDGLINGSVVDSLTVEYLDFLDDYLSRSSMFKDKLLELCIRNLLKLGLNGKVTMTDLEGIRSLECNGYGIRYLDGIENLKNLQHLTLISNNLIDISKLQYLTGLFFVDLSNNYITDYEQVKKLDSVMVFVNNNCINYHLEYDDNLDEQFVFGLDRQDNCTDFPDILQFDYDLKSGSFTVRATSRFVSPCTILKRSYANSDRVEYITGYGNNISELYADGMEYIVPYDIRKDVNTTYEFTCYRLEYVFQEKYISSVKRDYGNSSYIYKGKNFLIKEINRFDPYRFFNLGKDLISAFGCSYLYTQENNLIALCRELYEDHDSITGTSVKNYILVFRLDENRLDLTDFKIIDDDKNAGYWIFIGRYHDKISAVNESGIYIFSVQDGKILDLEVTDNFCDSTDERVYFINDEYNSVFFPCITKKVTNLYRGLILEDHYLHNNGYIFKIFLDPGSDSVNLFLFDKENLRFNGVKRINVRHDVSSPNYRRVFLRYDRLYLFLDKSIFVFNIDLPKISLVKKIDLTDTDVKYVVAGYPLSKDLLLYSYYTENFKGKTTVIDLHSDEVYLELDQYVLDQDNIRATPPFNVTYDRVRNLIINFSSLGGFSRIKVYKMEMLDD